MEYLTKEELMQSFKAIAKEYAITITNGNWVKEDGSLNSEFINAYSQKLTDLVALKCSDVCINDYAKQGCYGAGWRLSKEIQDFFGLSKEEQSRDGFVSSMLSRLKIFFGE